MARARRDARAALVAAPAPLIALICGAMPALLAVVLAAVLTVQLGQGGAADAEPRSAGRRWWVRPRAACWWDTDAQLLDDAEFRGHFRMCWDTFYAVCDLLRDRIERQDTQMHNAVHYEKVVAMALWRLATGDSFCSIAIRFGTSKSVVQDATHRVAAALCAVALGRVQRAPPPPPTR